MKKTLRSLGTTQQDYYLYLAHQSFANLGRAEHCYATGQYPLCASSLFYSAEFFWKALTILSGHYFDERHECSQADIDRVSSDVLSDEEKLRVVDILGHFSKSRRELAIYGYYRKDKSSQPPSKTFTADSVGADLGMVRSLVALLRRIHFRQVFTPPVSVGILSGYFKDEGSETPCAAYTWSEYGTAQKWLDSLANVAIDGGTKLFAPSFTHVSGLGAGTHPLVINPFGEAYPEMGRYSGVGFASMVEYVRNGGILVCTGGHPFAYSWDVLSKTGDLNPVVPSIPVAVPGPMPDNFVGFTSMIQPEALLLTREFGVTTMWDVPEKDVFGPQQIKLSFTGLLGEDLKGRTIEVSCFRPLRATAEVNPVAKSETEFWGRVYPLGLVGHGMGYLLCAGMSLKEKREYDVLLDVIVHLCRNGCQTLG